MRDISEDKWRLADLYARKHCGVDSVKKCPNPSQCSCVVAAEILAYKKSVIPDPYWRYKITDFDGLSDKREQLLEDQVALRAKRSVIEYCWRGVTLNNVDDMMSKGMLQDHSIMDERLAKGVNVIVYADNENWKRGSLRRGRTMVASLIMSAAIDRRIVPGNHVQTYDWIQYPLLKGMLKNDDMGVAAIKTCDWLVVDDITPEQNGSRAMKAMWSNFLDTFFFERLKEGLPTILVFRFDVLKTPAMSDELGVAMTKIVCDNKTHAISLCGE
jgi:hypothetical protein